jgi:hypothetical protein
MLFWMVRRTVPRRVDPAGCAVVGLVFAVLAVLSVVMKGVRAVSNAGWGPLLVIGVGVAVFIGLGVLGARMAPPPRPPLVPRRPPQPPRPPLPPVPPEPSPVLPVTPTTPRKSYRQPQHRPQAWYSDRR